ncbi:ABC-F family ATP-binding cassette domain-containing protein [uncultured Demequina sp.]|uniref:ABC-F family ATP-binding cassette domain-containing protein n=1 Tax=uncultured Demequina sp. TaxID=693499 RepID=UPI0025D23233|nr:ABC-F family ATP-binding cassette domain-containing protein [uncultured Demequina sp.]
MPSLTLSHTTFTWPDGTPCLADATLAFPAGLTGVVGANGAGKSTLLRLLTGDLAPTAGTLTRPPDLAHVRQDIALDPRARADAVLGLAEVRAALRAVESGSIDATHYETIGDDWDAEERAQATLARLGLPPGTLDRTVGELSGGEITLLAIAAALHRRPEVLLLDEPTNNLDAVATDRVVDALVSRRGTTVVVTHDRGLLDRVDRIVELQAGRLRVFGGPFAQYEETLAAERLAVEEQLRSARAQASRQKRELREHVEGIGRRQRDGERRARQSGMPKVMMGAMKRASQASQGRITGVHEERLEAAQQRLERAEVAADRDREIRVALPGTAVPARRDVARLESCTLRSGATVDASIQGPERIVLSGPNGSGKTTLIQTLLGAVAPVSGAAGVHVPVGLLPQRLDILDPGLSVVDNVRAAAPDATPHEVREGLARFLFRGRAGDGAAGTLSGGERFRAALAAVLLARPAPQLLILDEPTNNLDFASRAHLLDALRDYRGALIVVSHDAEFVAAVEPTREWRLGPGGFSDRDRGSG